MSIHVSKITQYVKKKQVLRTLTLVVLVGGLLSLYGFSKPTKSVEMAFSELSAQSKLAIIPASCPSDPHYFGECSTPTPCPDGSTRVGDTCPTQTRCPDGSIPIAGRCDTVPTLCLDGTVADSTGLCPGPEPDCPSGTTYVLNNTETSGRCVIDICKTATWFLHPECYTTPPPPTCNTPYHLSWGRCVACPVNSTWNGVVCVVTSCPPGYTLVSGVCQAPPITCPAGYTMTNGVCVITCSYRCVGDELVNSCTGDKIKCARGCADRMCVAQGGVAVRSFEVHPSLVRKGQAVTVLWSVERANSCSVTGTDGKYVEGLSGTFTATISQQTVYTLRCRAFGEAVNDDGSPYVWQDITRTVNIIPEFNER